MIFLILASSTACSTDKIAAITSTPASIRASITSTEIPPVRTPERTPTPSSTTHPFPTDTPSSPTDYPTINPEGPYLLSGRILLNPDGSGMKRIEFPEGFGLGRYSPDGEWRVLFAGGYAGDAFTGACLDCDEWTEMSLWLMHIPDGKIIQVAGITTRAILYEHHNWGECGLPIGELIDVQWSPDGRYLAFIADPVGSSMDLFTYDTDLHILRRLTNPGIADVLEISWSPDGDRIFYVNGVELATGGISDVGSYRRFTLNSQSPTERPDQGIRMYYTGREKPAILWMNNSNDLLMITIQYYQCISGTTEATLLHLNLETEKINAIGPERFLFDIVIDPDHRMILFETGERLQSDRNFYLADFEGNILAAPGESFSGCQYFGDGKFNFLCLSIDSRKLFGVSPTGKLEEAAGPADEIRGLLISPERNWFVVDHAQGLDVYSREAALVHSWVNAEKKSGYLWAPDEKGLYFLAESGKLYSWFFEASPPSLVFECNTPGNCLGNFLMWVKLKDDLEAPIPRRQPYPASRSSALSEPERAVFLPR